MRLARPRRRTAFMGLTPLIDMIFLLLLFFLLGSDFVTYGQSLLAPPRGSGGAQSTSQPVIIALAASGELSWNGMPTDKMTMARDTTKLVGLNDEQVMVLMPNGKADIQQVTDVMDVLIGAGAKAVTLERDVFDIDLSDF